MKTAFLIGAGQACDCPFSPQADDVVIGVDGGWAYCQSKGIVPQLLVGDFDSVGALPSHIPLLRLPVEKDDTDMRVAAHEALRQGCDTFHILGGTGGRPDHTFANCQLLLALAEAGAVGCLWGETYVTTVVAPGILTFPKEGQGDFSVFAFGGKAEEVCVTGAKYEAKGITLTPDYPIGVSNGFKGESVTLSHTKGFLLVMWQKQGEFLPVIHKKSAK